MIACIVLVLALAVISFLVILLIRRFKPRPPGGDRGRSGSSPPLSTDLDTVDCDPDMEIGRTPLPEPTFLSNAAQYGVYSCGPANTANADAAAATVRYPTLGRSSNRALRNSHHGGDSGSCGGGSVISPTPPRDTVVRYSTIGRHRISPSGGSGICGGAPLAYQSAGGQAGGSGGVTMYAGMMAAPIYAPGSAYSGVSNHSSYLDADLADPRSLTRSQQSDFPFYD